MSGEKLMEALQALDDDKVREQVSDGDFSRVGGDLLTDDERGVIKRIVDEHLVIDPDFEVSGFDFGMNRAPLPFLSPAPMRMRLCLEYQEWGVDQGQSGWVWGPC